MKKLIRIIRNCFAVFLAAVMAAGSPLAVYAETTNTYISSISIGSKADLIEAGYTVVDNDIRASSLLVNLTGSDPSGKTDGMYLGYKTTMKRTEAITDIRALNMYGGYSELDFDSLVAARMSEITDTANYLLQAILEFRTNYAKGKKPAKIAYDTLNAFYVPETGQALGDYFLDTKIGATEITSLVLMASSAVLSYIINMLVLAVSDDVTAGDKTWLQRAVEIGPFNFEGYSQGKIEEFFSQNYDNEYRQGAYYILSALKIFVETYEEGLKVYPKGVVTDLEELNQKASESDTYAYDILSGEEEDDPRTRYAMAFAVMDELNSTDDEGYKYYYGANADGSERSLGQYLLQIVHTAETDETKACRMIYPLLIEVNGEQVFTPGQEVAMSLSDFSTFFAVTASDKPDYDAAAKDYSENVSELLAINNNEKISVFFGINTSVYTTDKDIYMTSKLVRETAGNDRYSIITETATHNDDLTKSQQLWNKMMTASCWAVGALGGAIIGIYVVAKTEAALAAGTAFVTACNIGLTVGTILGVVAVLALVVAAIFLFIYFLDYEEAKDDESEAEKERKAFKWKDIPTYIYDYKKSEDTSADFGQAIAYESVNYVGTDKPANINSSKSTADYKTQDLKYDETQSWNVLYYTKDVDAGSPLCLNNSSSSPFIVQYDDGIPSDYSCVRFFEEKSPGNLNLGENLSLPVYIMMHRLDNGVADNSEKGKYISDVILCSGSSADGVIGEIMKKEDDYDVLYYNLTPDVEGLYTFIGYTTTNNPDYAIRDLRVAYGAASDKVGTLIYYGGAQYTICGDVGELILCETRYQQTGTPILTSQVCYYNGSLRQCCGLMAVTALDTAPEGYEPVNLFCGGPAFDFNGGGNWEALVTNNEGVLRDNVGNETQDRWSTHVYVYFNPETKFVGGEKYLGGLAFFSLPGDDTSYITEAGWTMLDSRNLGGVQGGTKTRLCYYETCNPYRAVYDIKAYKAELSATGVPYNITYGSAGGYVACDVYAQGGGGLGNRRTIRATHSYRSCYYLEGGGYAAFKDAVEYAIATETSLPSFNYVSNGLYEVATVNGAKYYSKINCIGLYVTGKSSKTLDSETPLKVSDLNIYYTKPESTDGESLYDYNYETPVRDFRDAYSDYAENLGADTRSGTNKDFYLFIERPDENHEVPEYISSVTVKYTCGNSDGSNTPFDAAIVSLVANGEGRLYELNLSGNASPWTCSVYYDSCTADEDNVPSTKGRYGDDYWIYEFSYNVLSTECVKNAQVAYLWITYTDIPTNALSDIVILKTTDINAVKDKLGYYYTSTQKKSTRSNLCGTAWFMDSDPGYYFALYSINHNGHVISDLDFSDVPMINGKWTSLGFDNKCVSMGNLYLHTTHVEESTGSNKYVSGIYTSTGSNWREAQINLLNQGCRMFVGYDINPSGAVNYLGYAVTMDYENAYSSFKLVESGQDDTITKAQYGWDVEYEYMSSSLNSAAASIIIKLFGSHSDSVAAINGGYGDDGHYIDTFMFSDTAKDYITTEQNGQTWKWSLVTDMDGNPQAVSMGFVDKGGSEKEYVETAYMYVHYSDNEFDRGNVLGAVFSNSGNVFVIICGFAIILAGAFIAVVAHKRRLRRN